MSSSQTSTRLESATLDEVISELDLDDSDAIDRLNDWFGDLRAQVWEWLKSATGGEEGWLSRFGDWLRDLLPENPGENLPDATPIMTGISWVATLALVGLVGYVLYQIWLIYKPRKAVQDNLLFEQMRADAAMPLDALPLARQPAAVFAQVCVALVDAERVEVRPDSTHMTIAVTADLSEEPAAAFRVLARAADRGLFGAWEPDAEEMNQLADLRQRILGGATPG